MGIEIIAAYKKWIKQPQEFYRPVLDEGFVLGKEEYYITAENYKNSECYFLYNEEFHDLLFDQEIFDIYVDLSNNFINKMMEQNISLEFKNWLNCQKGKMLLLDINLNMYSAENIELYTIKRWCGCEEIDFDECGKALFSAISNVNYFYDLNLYDALISDDDLYYYKDTDSELDKEVETQINKDISYLLKDIETYFNNVVKKFDDNYFESRNEKIKIIYNIIKQGGKMIYSV